MAFKLDEAYVEITARMETFATQLGDARKDFEKWTTQTQKALVQGISGFAKWEKSVGKSFTNASRTLDKFAIGFKALIAGAAVGELVRSTTDWADKMGDLAAKTGMSTEFLSTLDYQLKQTDGSIEDFVPVVKKMANVLDDARQGNDAAVETLARLGFSVSSFAGMSPEQSFQKFADAIRNVKDPMEKVALAQDVFGKGAQGLLPYLETSKGTLNLLADAARQYGLAIDSLSMARLSNLHDTIVRVKSAFFGFALELMTKAAPTLEKLGTLITEKVIPMMRQALENFDVGKFLEDVGARLLKFGEFIGQTWTKLKEHFSNIKEFLAPVIEKMKEWGWWTDDSAAALAALGIEAGLVSTVGAPLLGFIGDVILASAGFTKAIATMIGAEGKGGVLGFGFSCGLVVSAGYGGYKLGEWIYDMTDKRFPKLRQKFDEFGASMFDMFKRANEAMQGNERETSAWGNAVGIVIEKTKAVWKTLNDLVLGFIQAVVIAAQGNWPGAWDRMASAVEQFAQRCKTALFSIPIPTWMQQGFGDLQRWLGTPGWQDPLGGFNGTVPHMDFAPQKSLGNSQQAAGNPVVNVNVHVNGTAGEAPETFARRVARAVAEGQRQGAMGSGALLALP